MAQDKAATTFNAIVRIAKIRLFTGIPRKSA
jgi:hypothetical protein